MMNTLLLASIITLIVRTCRLRRIYRLGLNLILKDEPRNVLQARTKYTLYDECKGKNLCAPQPQKVPRWGGADYGDGPDNCPRDRVDCARQKIQTTTS